MLKIAIIAPSENYLFSRLIVSELSKIENVCICSFVIKKKPNLTQLIKEYKSDGSRKIRVIYQKYILNKNNEEKSNYAINSLKKYSQQNNIPYIFVDNINNEKAETFLKDKNLDIILFTGGGLLRKNIISIPKIGILNCHPGILPYYRGNDILEWVIAEDKVNNVGLGVTLHLIDEGVDTGPILLTKRIKGIPSSNIQTIKNILEQIKVELMVKGIKQIRDNHLKLQPQKISDGKQYYKMHPRIENYAKEKLSLIFKSSK